MILSLERFHFILVYISHYLIYIFDIHERYILDICMREDWDTLRLHRLQCRFFFWIILKLSCWYILFAWIRHLVIVFIIIRFWNSKNLKKQNCCFFGCFCRGEVIYNMWRQVTKYPEKRRYFESILSYHIILFPSSVHCFADALSIDMQIRAKKRFVLRQILSEKSDTFVLVWNVWPLNSKLE